jgi:hypothetical protein
MPDEVIDEEIWSSTDPRKDLGTWHSKEFW